MSELAAAERAAVGAQSARGLTSAEAAERIRGGLGNAAAVPTSRPLAAILRANVLTRFNAMLGGLLVVILVVGPLQDALFGLVLLANTGVGIVQELRAKRTLDRLSVVGAVRARVLRDGVVRSVSSGGVVLDDVVELAAGDQLVVDGTVIGSAGLELDESLLTGESEPVAKPAGSPVLSGSFVVAGHGRYLVTAVGADAYAARLAAEGRRFTLVSSELRDGTNRLLRMITWVMLPTAGLLAWSQFTHVPRLADALRGSVAGVVTMIPEGLVLLTSVALAIGVVRLGRRRVLVQELAAVETLARVDVVGIDKTGTLTTGDLRVATVEPLAGADPLPALGALAAGDPHPNPTLRALADHCPDPGWTATATVPFSSARRWSGASFAGGASWLLAAPEVLADRLRPAAVDWRARRDEHARQGHRVLLLARGDQPLTGGAPPDGLTAAALVVLAETVRPQARATLRYFTEQGVAVKVISGDHPATVAAIAAAVGLPFAERAVDAAELPTEPAALATAVEAATVFGRVDPHRKRTIVAALRASGHVVAMTGDGVNDVLALKDADVGVAMGSGSPAARAVAQLVLLDDRFDALPPVVAEGRRVIGNIERVANLFLTKTVYATLLALVVGAARLPFPFLPRQLTVVSTLTIGVPGFVLALAPNRRRAVSGFVPRVLRFAVPAGAVAAAATFLAYAEARDTPGLSLAMARSVATVVLVGVALVVLARIGRALPAVTVPLLVAMAGAFAGILAVPWLSRQLALPLPAVPVLLSAAGVVAGAAVGLRVVEGLLARWWGPLDPGRRDGRGAGSKRPGGAR